MKRALWLILSLLLLVSLASGHWLGLMGRVVAAVMRYLLGLSSYSLVPFTALWGLGKVSRRNGLLFALYLLGSCLLLTASAELFPRFGSLFDAYSQEINSLNPAYRELRFNLGGKPFYLLYRDLQLYKLLSPIGTWLLALAGTLGPLLMMVDWSRFKREELPELEEPMPPPPPPPPPLSPKPRKQAPAKVGEYRLPSPSLLTSATKADTSHLKATLKRQSEVLEETLGSFGIDAKVCDVKCGPSITSFEVQPAIGVKVQRIKALESDIALNMQARSIRILAPIPGKAAVGIEVPNAQPQEVGFREMLARYLKGGSGCHLPLLLGKGVNGEDVAADLTRMPHCIIAGATGSGKSVCVNTIVMSILMTARPDQVRLLMVDPKKVELTAYSELPHMIAPVITEPKEACTALNWLVKEMERRYKLLKQLGLRHIAAFNSRKSGFDEEIPRHLPYIVGIIDELADLMMASSSDIETPITRIAQMARAVGIHLIIATQRPSREVITGLIKANFPTRIAFKVASRINSQIILDETGAETLLGNGDMLFLPPGSSGLVRAQGTFIRDEDINRVIEQICSQAPPDYLIQSFANAEEEEEELEEGDRDPLYTKALQVVRLGGLASTTFLQRKLKIGYARAASIMDRFEEEGIVGPQEGSKPRRVLNR